jgi:hypothetical protein
MRPFYFTQLGASGAVNRACRTATICNCMMDATRNEANLNGLERHRGKGGRLATVKKGWRAFENQTPPDPNGWADRGDVILMKDAMFPGYPDPIVSRERPQDVWDAIGEYSVSIAINTANVPSSSPVRRWVGPVPHQGKAHKKKTANGVRMVKWTCPMRPASDTFDGLWVKWEHIVDGARALPGAQGEMFVELFPKNEWTQAAFVAERKDERIENVKDTRDRRTAERDQAREDLAAASTRVVELTLELENERKNGRDAGWESALVAIKEDADRRRTEGPS